MHFFISYTQVDLEWAEWIAWEIEGAGHTTHIQEWDSPAGSGFVHEMHRAAQEADRTVAVLSRAYLRSAYGEAEWQAAWAEDPLGEERKLLVFRVEDCDRPGLLRQIDSRDLFDREELDARRLLLGVIGAAVRPRRRKPRQNPDFPGGAPRGNGGATPVFPGPAGGRSRRRNSVSLRFDVREKYGRSIGVLAEEMGLHDVPASWDHAELSDLRDKVDRRPPPDSAKKLLEARDTLVALCDALDAKPVLTALGVDQDALGLSPLHRIYWREVGQQPEGGSSDALLVEAAGAAINERRGEWRDRPGGQFLPLDALARFVLGISFVLGKNLNDTRLSRWIRDRYMLKDARDYLEKRNAAKPVWLLIDLDNDPIDSARWPRSVSVILQSEEGVLAEDKESWTRGGSKNLTAGLRRLLERVTREEGDLLVDVAAPCTLLDKGIEKWPLIELDEGSGEYERLIDRYKPRLRWSKRLYDHRIDRGSLERWRRRAADGADTWGAEPAVLSDVVVERGQLTRWLADCLQKPYMHAGGADGYNGDKLRNMLYEGCGFVVWFPSGINSEVVEKLEEAAAGVPPAARRFELPEKFHNELYEVSDSGVVIIWDDPDGREGIPLPPPPRQRVRQRVPTQGP